MKPILIVVAVLGLAWAARAATPVNDPAGVRTLPTAIGITPLPVQTEDATYSFDITLAEPKVIDGTPQLKVYTTIVKTAGATQTRFSAIIVQVPQDASSLRLKADGEQFVLEASYRDPFDRTAEPRQVATTFGQMFNCGKVGLTVRLAQ